jgi:putative Mg2+ transporter-C (MgtC) family protein
MLEELLKDPVFSPLFVILPQLVVSTICGFIIGIEREYKDKPAGIRTMVLISVGCTIFTSLALTIEHSDPSRIIAQIITGIGFLGGGVIIKNDDRIIGVTTAAFIWFVSSIGILAGLGHIITPIFLTAGFMIISLLLGLVENLIKKIR